MRIRRKTGQCLNCETTISEVYNYCPKCGQENNNHNISFGLLFKEFFSNYFSLDSRFGRSIKPFLTKPGNLTQSFNGGKRVRYAHPVRLYLVISLIHFTVFSFVQDRQDSEDDSHEEFINMMDDSDVDSLLAIHPDSIHFDPEEDWPMHDRDFALVIKMYDENHSYREIIDSLNIEDRSFWDRLAIKRFVRLAKTTKAEINSAIIQNIPIMMFVILPLYALLLKIFYRKKGLYIQHLIHSFHIHSFAFFALTLCWLLVLALNWEIETVIFFIFLIISIYIYISLKKVYLQGYVLTFFKVFLIGTIYSFMLSIAMLVETIISLMIY